MGQYIEHMKDVLKAKVDAGTPLDKAARHIRRGLIESAELWEKGADIKRETYAGRIDPVVAREIDFLESLAGAERERAEDIESLITDGWKP